MTYATERIRFGPAIKRNLKQKTSTNREREVKKIPGKGKCAQKLKQNRIDFLEKIP